jgi:hypothetical protein
MVFGDWLARGKRQPNNWYCQNAERPDRYEVGSSKEDALTDKENARAANEKRHELCNQWRQAEAAEESAHVAWVQFWVGLAGLGGLMATVIFAAMSANAASAAANAMIDNERPWVGPETVGHNALVANCKIDAWVIIKNTGKSPAREMRVRFWGRILPAGQTPHGIDATQAVPKALFPAVPDYYYPFQREPVVTQAQLAEIRTGKLVPWIIGRIDYLDGRGNRCHTNICTNWERSRDAFVPYKDGNDAA